MSIANLHESWLTCKARINQLTLDITNYQSQKTLATYSQADLQSLLSSEKHSQRDYFKTLWDNDPELQEKYKDYTEIPDFEEAIDKLTAKYQDQLDEMAAWETALDTQITTADAEKKEQEAFKQSLEDMLKNNIQGDFNFGLNG